MRSHAFPSSRFPHAIAASIALFVGAEFAGASGAFYNLGVGMTVSGVSADGTVAAGTGNGQYFYWTAKTGIVLIGGTAPGGGAGGQAKVSNDGTLIAGTRLNPVSGLLEMSIYDIASGTWTALGGIGSPCSQEISSGWNISGDGGTVVGLGWLGCASAHAIRWTQTESTIDLGSTVANRSSRANSVNDDGSVIVGWQDGETGFRQGAIWINGQQTLIFVDAAQTNPISEASDVSADGQWIVGNGASTNGFQAWRWNATTGSATGVQSFGPWPSNPSWRGAGTGISDDGSKIVGYYRPFPGPATLGQGFIWTESAGMVNLNAYATDNAVSTGGLTLALPLAVSADGNTIVGLGSGGVGFVLTIDPSLPCPADVNGSGAVDVSDLVAVILGWGDCPKPPAACDTDVNDSGAVDVSDLVAVILGWGPCQ